MRSLIIVACVVGVALCAPRTLYYELQYQPVQAVPAVPAVPSVPMSLLTVQRPAGAPALPAHGFIKHEIPQPAGQESVEVLYPFGFAPAAPAAPAAPVVPVAPVAPVAPIARVSPPRKVDDDDDDHDD